MSQTKIANRISIGDCHDLSIEWFMTHTAFPVYEIERVGERWKITGRETNEVNIVSGFENNFTTETPVLEQKEVKDARKANEKKPEKAVAADGHRTTKPKPGGKRGRSKTGKSGKK